MHSNHIGRIVRYFIFVIVLTTALYGIVLVKSRKQPLVYVHHTIHNAIVQSKSLPLTSSSRKGPILFQKTKQLQPKCKYSNLKSFEASDASDSSDIPKLVHWIYPNVDVPSQYVDLARHCQKINPDHTFIFWTDKSALSFIKENYPKYHYLFTKKFENGLEFSDGLRYFILLHYGGIYLDLDVECRKPFSESITRYKCVVDRERETQTMVYWGNPFNAMNSVMACQRNHPFFQQCIKKLTKSVMTEKGILARTGPVFLTTYLLKYNKTELSRIRPVVMAESSVFSPLMDENHLPIFRSICMKTGRINKIQENGCNDFKKNGYSHGNVAELTKNSITIHRYMHLGWGSWKHRIVSKVSICNVAEVNIHVP